MLVCAYLSKAGEGLKDLEVTHNVKESVSDGTYQIDVKATFEIFGGSNIVVLVECKKYSSPVKREKVEILYSRLQSLGANKGIIFSASGFQQGAYEFATKHGIALIRILDDKFIHEVRSQDMVKNVRQLPSENPEYVGVYIYNIEEKSCKVTTLRNNFITPLADFIFK